MLTYLDAGWATFRSLIWGYRYIIRDSQILNGNKSRRDYKKDLAVKGKLLSLGGRLVHLQFRHYTDFIFLVYRLILLFCLGVRTLLAVCILIMQRPGVMLKPFKQ